MEHITCVFGRKDMAGHDGEMSRGHNHALFLGGCHLESPSAVAIRPSLGDETKLLLSLILKKLRNGTSRIDFYLNILFQPSK